MSTFDVTKAESKPITRVKWCSDEDFDLIQSGSAVTIHTNGVTDLDEGTDLLSSQVEAENLIKAIQKTIDLGWYS